MKRSNGLLLVLLAVFAILLLAACGSTAVTPDPTAPKPSNSGGTGKALTLTGDPVAGKEIFDSTCATCHGSEGTGGVENSGAAEEVPELKPADEFYNADPAVFAANLDLFIEHGSKPEGDNPTLSMPAFGDDGTLTAQQIADVIAYVISLNKK